MESTSHKLTTTMCTIGQIIMSLVSLIGFILAIYAVSFNNVPVFRLVEGTFIALFGFAGCFFLEKIKANLASIHVEMGLTE